MYNKGIFEEIFFFLTVTHCSIVLGVINIFFENFFQGSTFNHHTDDGKRNRLSQQSLINLCRIPTLRSPTKSGICLWIGSSHGRSIIMKLVWIWIGMQQYVNYMLLICSECHKNSRQITRKKWKNVKKWKCLGIKIIMILTKLHICRTKNKKI